MSESAARDPLEPPGQPPHEAGPADLMMHFGPLWFDAHRVIYATIILLSAYALYDEGTDPFGTVALVEMVAVTISPLFALAMAHAFSDAIDLQIRNGRRLNRHDRRHLAAVNAQYLYVAVPPTAIIALLSLLRWDANTIIEIVQLIGLGTLAFWGAYAARVARLGRWTQVRFAASYLVMGALVIIVELILTH